MTYNISFKANELSVPLIYPFHCRDFLFKLDQHESWIGVKNMNEEGNFENMLNEIVNYTNWESNELNDGSNERGGCVSISYEIWSLKECSSYLPALCSLRYKPGKCSKCQLKKMAKSE